MKPLKLTMQAFGPFANQQEIDFTSLGSNPLFLINGPTGSGKTSILDAMSFALYGETTGDERQGTQMRSDLAKINVATEVTFEFALQEKIYRVIRSPEQEAPKARGEGTTTRKHTAALYQIGEDDTLITSKTAQVKSEITQLLGLNETQFRQVMVLPQGKFRELLLASSKDREDIFGQLFQTEIYKKIEFALKDKASAISKAKNEFDNQIRGALNVAEVESEPQLIALLESEKQNLNSAQESELKARTELDGRKRTEQQANALVLRFKQKDQANHALNEHLANEASYLATKQRLEAAKRANTLTVPYQRWKQNARLANELVESELSLKEQVEQSKLSLDSASKKLQTAESDAKEIPKLNDELYALETVQSKLLERDQLSAALNQSAKTLEEQNQTLAKYIAYKDKLANDLTLGQQQLEALKISVSEKPKLESELESIARKQQDLTKLAQMRAEHSALEEVLPELQHKVEHEKKILDEKQLSADRLELSWHQAQAAVLAQKLQDGEACPVCGSHEHPLPAAFAGETIDKQSVDLAREQHRRALHQFTQAENQLAQQQMLVSRSEKQLNAFIQELGLDSNQSIEPLEARARELSQQLNQLSTIDLAGQEAKLDELAKRCEKGEAEINQVREQLAATKAQQGELGARLDALNTQLDPKLATLESVQNTQLEFKKRVESLSQNLEQASKSQQQANTQYSTLQGQFEQTTLQLTKAKQQLAADEQQWRQALAETEFTDEQSYLNASANESQLASWQSEAESFTQNKIKLEQTVADLSRELSDQSAPDMAAIQTEREKAEQTYGDVRAQLDAARSKHERYEKVAHDIDKLHEQNAQLEKEYQVYGTLYDVASGKTGSRVSLHRFVLGVLLDDVLVQASQRLSLMSKGRYILMRKTEGFKGVAGRGLDLIVEDGYTGKTRDVATLSGGESFMAALSLALGLSDVVQSYSGGIRLETLFIDEGFGSLDPESLDLAIQTLIDLQQSGRTIGLISHVSELKEQMSQRIDVVPSKWGSQVNLVAM